MTDLARQVRSKVRLRLLYPLIFLMLLAAIDRSNIGFAALRMNAELHLTPSQYGLGAGVFYIGFLAGQYPSVLLSGRIGIKAWLAVTLVTWGVAAGALAFVQGYQGFLALRILLGFAEAGLTPGIVLYLGGWAPSNDRASIFALPMLAIPLGYVVGGPFSGWLLSAGAPFPMESWRWMFLVEGVPVIVFAIVAYSYFPSTPGRAPWLTEEEETWIGANRAMSADVARGSSSLGALVDIRVLAMMAAWFLLLGGAYAMGFWLPLIIKSAGHLSDLQIGLVSAIPWVFNAIAVAGNAIHSDRTGERFWHFGIAALTAAAAFILIGWVHSPLLALAILVVGAMGIGGAQGVFWAIPTAIIPKNVMAAGVTFVNVAGCAAGVVIPWLVGALREATGSYATPIYLVAAMMGVSFLVLLPLRAHAAPADARPDHAPVGAPETP